MTTSSEILLTGAVVFRKGKSSIEWLLQKNNSKGWEFPKGTVKRGESSVGAILRLLREDLLQPGIELLEEAGRTKSTSLKNGTRTTEKCVFYLTEQKGPDENKKNENLRWAPFHSSRKNLSLERERKVLELARDVLKECLRIRKNKKQALSNIEVG